MMVRRTTTVFLAAVLMLLTACSGGETPSGSANAEGGAAAPEKVVLGIAPTAASGVLQLGIEKGFFKEEGIDLKLQAGAGTAVLLPALVAGQIQFAAGEFVSLLKAQEQGIDVRPVIGFTHNYPTGEDCTATYARPEAGVKRPADLQGKTVATNTLTGLVTVAMKQMVKNDGGDPNKVKFVELGFPDMAAALKAGSIDAMYAIDPYRATVKAQGANLVGYPFQQFGSLANPIMASEKTLKNNPGLVDRVVRAAKKSFAYADAHRDEVFAAAKRGIVPELNIEQAKNFCFSQLGSEIQKESVLKLAEALHQQGILTQPVNEDRIFSGIR